jgi:hypothetical protein
MIAFLCAGLALASIASANLITNGDFSSGVSGFASGYGYVAPVNQGSCYPETTFTIATSPNICHNLWANFGDHTTGTGNMMIVNGATVANDVVWEEGPTTGNAGLSSLQQNTNYYFSGWIAATYPTSPADLQFAVQGNVTSQALGTFTASTTTGLWQQFYVTWNSGSNTSANLTIVDLNTAASGNDFALDDLSFDRVSSVPEPSSLIVVVGASLLLLSARRRWSNQ